MNKEQPTISIDEALDAVSDVLAKKVLAKMEPHLRDIINGGTEAKEEGTVRKRKRRRKSRGETRQQDPGVLVIEKQPSLEESYKAAQAMGSLAGARNWALGQVAACTSCEELADICRGVDVYPLTSVRAMGIMEASMVVATSRAHFSSYPPSKETLRTLSTPAGRHQVESTFSDLVLARSSLMSAECPETIEDACKDLASTFWKATDEYENMCWHAREYVLRYILGKVRGSKSYSDATMEAVLSGAVPSALAARSIDKVPAMDTAMLRDACDAMRGAKKRVSGEAMLCEYLDKLGDKPETEVVISPVTRTYIAGLAANLFDCLYPYVVTKTEYLFRSHGKETSEDE